MKLHGEMMRAILSILGLGALIAIITLWNVPERATLIVLTLTLLALIIYAHDTNRIAKQFRGYWIANLFKDFSSRIDACLKDLDNFQVDLSTMDIHNKEFDKGIRVFIALFPDKQNKDYLETQRDLLDQLWKNAWVRQFRDGGEKQEIVDFLGNLKAQLQVRIGKLV